MNEASNSPPHAPTQNTGRHNADSQQDQTDLQDNTQKHGNAKNAQGQDRSNQSGGRSGNDSVTKPTASKGADGQRSPEDRKQRQSVDGGSPDRQKNPTDGTANRPGASDPTKSDADIDLDDDESDEADGKKQNKSDAAQELTAGPSKAIKQSNNSVRPDANRQGRDQTNQHQGGRKN